MDWSTIGVKAFNAMLPAILAGVAWLGHRLEQWLRTKTSIGVAAAAMQRLDDIITMVVTRLEQTQVGPARERAGGVPFPFAEAMRFKNKAIDDVRAYYGADGMLGLAKDLGMEPDALDAMVSDKIEVAVYRIKNPGQDGIPVFRSGPPTPPQPTTVH